MPTEEVVVGKINDYTRNLSPDDIREAVERWAGRDLAGWTISPVWVAPAENSGALTRAAKEWRAEDTQRDEFTDYIKDRPFWFGLHLSPPEGGDQAAEEPDDEVPSSWPPEGPEEAPADAPDPQIAEQLGDDLDGTRGS